METSNLLNTDSDSRDDSSTNPPQRHSEKTLNTTPLQNPNLAEGEQLQNESAGTNQIEPPFEPSFSRAILGSEQSRPHRHSRLSVLRRSKDIERTKREEGRSSTPLTDRLEGKYDDNESGVETEVSKIDSGTHISTRHAGETESGGADESDDEEVEEDASNVLEGAEDENVDSARDNESDISLTEEGQHPPIPLIGGISPVLERSSRKLGRRSEEVTAATQPGPVPSSSANFTKRAQSHIASQSAAYGSQFTAGATTPTHEGSPTSYLSARSEGSQPAGVLYQDFGSASTRLPPMASTVTFPGEQHPLMYQGDFQRQGRFYGPETNDARLLPAPITRMGHDPNQQVPSHIRMIPLRRAAYMEPRGYSSPVVYPNAPHTEAFTNMSPPFPLSWAEQPMINPGSPRFYGTETGHGETRAQNSSLEPLESEQSPTSRKRRPATSGSSRVRKSKRSAKVTVFESRPVSPPIVQSVLGSRGSGLPEPGLATSAHSSAVSISTPDSPEAGTGQTMQTTLQSEAQRASRRRGHKSKQRSFKHQEDRKPEFENEQKTLESASEQSVIPQEEVWHGELNPNAYYVPAGQHAMNYVPGQQPYDVMIPQQRLSLMRAAQQTQAKLEIEGDLMQMTRDWSDEELDIARRLVLFHRQQQGVKIRLTFESIDADKYREDMTAVSCIWNRETHEFFITSVDCIVILELIMGQRFSIEEKNRTRRNLEACKPVTISKTKPELEPFFRQIMGYEEPRPRNIEKDLKVFLWDNLESALKKIVSKYSAVNQPQQHMQ